HVGSSTVISFEIPLASGREERIDDTLLLLQVVCVRDAPLNAPPHYPRVGGGDSGLLVPAAPAPATWAPALDGAAVRSERGRMFWLWWKTLSGSYLVFTSTSRS